jgi:hypothetical protein
LDNESIGKALEHQALITNSLTRFLVALHEYANSLSTAIAVRRHKTRLVVLLDAEKKLERKIEEISSVLLWEEQLDGDD